MFGKHKMENFELVFFMIATKTTFTYYVNHIWLQKRNESMTASKGKKIYKYFSKLYKLFIINFNLENVRGTI